MFLFEFHNLFGILQSTGAHCTVDKNAPPDAQEKNFIIRGTPDAVERAKAMIMEKLGMQDGGGGYGGGGRGGGGGGGGNSWGSQYQSPSFQQDAGNCQLSICFFRLGLNLSSLYCYS